MLPYLLYVMFKYESQWPKGILKEVAHTAWFANIETDYKDMCGYANYKGTFEDYKTSSLRRFEETWKNHTIADTLLVIEKVAAGVDPLEDTIRETESNPRFVKWASDPRKPSRWETKQ